MIKSRIKQKMREVSMRRMMQEVPHADVVITNPTHFACALKYDRERSAAPILVAKGADLMAQRIKDVAQENFVVLVEDKPLARTLYSMVDIGDEVPPELWQAVAEVLAYVYRLRNPQSA
jgi:flagellar biosynthetic protein FlhB